MPSCETLPDLTENLTVGRDAEYLGVSRRTLCNWDKAGNLKPYRHMINSYRLYRRDVLEVVLRKIQENHASDNSM